MLADKSVTLRLVRITQPMSPKRATQNELSVLLGHIINCITVT